MSMRWSVALLFDSPQAAIPVRYRRCERCGSNSKVVVWIPIERRLTPNEIEALPLDLRNSIPSADWTVSIIAKPR